MRIRAGLNHGCDLLRQQGGGSQSRRPRQRPQGHGDQGTGAPGGEEDRNRGHPGEGGREGRRAAGAHRGDGGRPR